MGVSNHIIMTLIEQITNRVKTLFSDTKHKFEGDHQIATLDNGSQVAAESFNEEGKTLYVVTSEGDFVTATAGDYVLSDQTVLQVDESGVIVSVTKMESEKAEVEKPEEKVDMAGYATKEELKQATDAIITAIAMLAKQQKTAQAVNQSADKKQEITSEEKARLKALELQLEEKRKKIGEPKKDEKQGLNDLLDENFGNKYQQPYANAATRRIAENFKDFEFEKQSTN
jgi:hypothetical protein